MNLATATYDELCDAYYSLSETLGEMRAENAGERAMFGDSAPGSAIVEWELSQDVNALRRELDARVQSRPSTPRTINLTQYEPGNLIPF